MQELNFNEINEVSGSGFWSSVGYAFGTVMGAGTATQGKISGMDNMMLNAMSYGA